MSNLTERRSRAFNRQQERIKQMEAERDENIPNLLDRIAELEAEVARYRNAEESKTFCTGCDARDMTIAELEKADYYNTQSHLRLQAENQRLKDALVEANNNQMAAAQCATDFKYGYEKRGKEIAELETLLNEYKDAECRAVKNEGEALKENQRLKALLKHIRTITDRQAEDEGLWFAAVTAPEAYLQQELRKLHSAIETAPAPDDDWLKQAMNWFVTTMAVTYSGPVSESVADDRIKALEALNASYNCDRERHHRLIDKLEEENQRLKASMTSSEVVVRLKRELDEALAALQTIRELPENQHE